MKIGSSATKQACRLILPLVIAFTLVRVNQARAQDSDGNASSQELITQAWNALENNNFKLAIEKASECAGLCTNIARAKQDSLMSSNAPIPDATTIDYKSDSGDITPEAHTIIRRGALNDAATSLFIIGEANRLAYLSNKDAKSKELAQSSYKCATYFSYGLTLQTNENDGWFWSPAYEAATVLTNPAAWDSSQVAQFNQLYHGNCYQLTSMAWAALTNRQFSEAISISKECVRKYERVARRIENNLANPTNNTPIPDPTEIDYQIRGRITPQATAILKRGPLNDVATCYFIIGEANRLIYKSNGDTNAVNSAIVNYNKATTFLHSLTLDARNPSNAFFWSPAAAADSWLIRLRGRN